MTSSSCEHRYFCVLCGNEHKSRLQCAAERAKATTTLSVTIPPELVGMKKELRHFFDAMIFKLAKNAHKGKWEDMDLAASLSRLREEADELEEAITFKHNTMEVVMEAADVANFAMIAAALAIEKGE